MSIPSFLFLIKSINIGEFSSASLSYIKNLFSSVFLASKGRENKTLFHIFISTKKKIRNKFFSRSPLKLVCLRVATIKMFTPSFVCIYMAHIICKFLHFVRTQFLEFLNCEKEAFFVSFISLWFNDVTTADSSY